MKIIVKEEAEDNELFDLSHDYTVDCCLESSECSSIDDYMKMIFRALCIETFSQETIIKGMKEFVSYWEFENNKVIEIDE